MIWFNNPHDLNHFTPAYAFLVRLLGKSVVLSANSGGYNQIFPMVSGTPRVHSGVEIHVLPLDARRSRCIQRIARS